MAVEGQCRAEQLRNRGWFAVARVANGIDGCGLPVCADGARRRKVDPIRAASHDVSFPRKLKSTPSGVVFSDSPLPEPGNP